jgi:hypothetical protein
MSKIKLKQTDEDFSLYEINKIRLSIFPITFLVVLSIVILLIYSIFFIPKI